MFCFVLFLDFSFVRMNARSKLGRITQFIDSSHLCEVIHKAPLYAKALNERILSVAMEGEVLIVPN